MRELCHSPMDESQLVPCLTSRWKPITQNTCKLSPQYNHCHFIYRQQAYSHTHLRIRLERAILLQVEQREFRFVFCRQPSPPGSFPPLSPLSPSFLPAPLTTPSISQRLTLITQNPLILIQIDNQILRLVPMRNGILLQRVKLMCPVQLECDLRLDRCCQLAPKGNPPSLHWSLSCPTVVVVRSTFLSTRFLEVR